MAEDTSKTAARRGDEGAGEGPITFYCSNGHRISVRPSLAGKRGTCSKCGIALTIPSPRRHAEAAVPADRPAAEEPRADLSALASAPERNDDGPSTAPAAAAEEGSELQKLFEAVGDGREGANDDVDAVESAVHTAAVGEAAAGGEPVPAGMPPHNPIADLVARLWAERGHGGIVELHLAGGSVILPEWYEPVWSRGTHGLFAGQAADGTVTLTAVAWDSIQKVVVRQVDGLPDGMFLNE
ncbi:MAG: hypothetical protein EBZ59_04655 [Planctomycetia bacterium]|nr:hypothetical protein [Planctomycetia bacterium]